MTKNYFLSGKKVGLRAVTCEDVDAYARWMNDPEVTRFLEMATRPVREFERDSFWRMANETDDAYVFSIDDLKLANVVGYCGLYMVQWACRRAQFNILVGDSKVWDQGFGSEAAHLCLDYAFNTLNLNSIQLGVNADNKRAVRSYEKVGFVHEGCRRQFIYRGGSYSDMIVMSILRNEYVSKK